jgi:hypothetical protein
MQDWFSIQRLSNAIAYINRLKMSNHGHLKNCRKSIEQNPTSIPDINFLSKLRIEGTFPNW